MRYPVSLVYANKLIEMIKKTPHWSDAGINENWLKSFQKSGKDSQ
jgi:hypothetical protein